MTLKLWAVRVETEIVVLAASREDAEDKAMSAVRSWQVTHGRRVHIDVVRRQLEVVRRQFAAEPDRTVGQWIEAGAAPEYRK